jgi:hypothetical protein
MARTSITTIVAPLATSPFPNGQLIDLLDLITLKDDLKILDSASDAFLRRGITRASTVASKYCNRMLPESSFQAQGYQDQIWSHREPYPSRLLMGLAPTLQLGRWPLLGAPSQAGTAPPVAAPSLSKVAGGALAAATCYVRTTYVTASGETAASLEASLAVPASNLLVVASPPADVAALAIGWNVYASSTAAGAETLQNGTTPIAIGTAWTELTSGLVAGTALPQAVLVIEDANINHVANVPVALIEGVDFTADRAFGQLTRLSTNGQPRHWDSRPIVIQYPAGYTLANLADAQEAVVQMVKERWFARTRDPMLRQENISGAYEASYWISALADRGAMTPEVTSLLDQYRVPVIG